VACRRGSIDRPVAIRALKWFVADRHAGSFREPVDFSEGACDGLEEMINFARFLASREYRKPEGARVAIIGSGPAGLAAAHDLALMGIAPVIFEAESRPAGMLYTGIPAYRLPRELIEAEIELIRRMGVEFHCGVKVGRDIEFEQLRHAFTAVIIAVGAKRARTTPPFKRPVPDQPVLLSRRSTHHGPTIVGVSLDYRQAIHVAAPNKKDTSDI
jgi:formate dehydrogenase (NADP+) beta subunit